MDQFEKITAMIFMVIVGAFVVVLYFMMILYLLGGFAGMFLEILREMADFFEDDQQDE